MKIAFLTSTKGYYAHQTPNDELMSGPNGWQFIYNDLYPSATYGSWVGLNNQWEAGAGFHVSATDGTLGSARNQQYLHYSGLSGAFLYDNGGQYQDPYYYNNAVESPTTFLGNSYGDIYNNLSSLTPSTAKPLFTTVDLTVASYGFDGNGNPVGYTNVKNEIAKLNAAYPGRFVFQTPSAFVATAEQYNATQNVVAIEANANGDFVSAPQAGANPLIADTTTIGLNEKFQLIYLSDGTVALQSLANGKYVTADAAGQTSLIANRGSIDDYEKFTLVDEGDGQVAVMAKANGDYVTADNGGSSPLIANRTSVGAWEKFTILGIPNGIGDFQANANGEYVSAANAGTSPLIANRGAVGQWESYSLTSYPDGAVSLRADANNDYVTANSAGTSPLIADQTAVGPSEKFYLLYLANGQIAMKANANGDFVTADNAGTNPLIANRTSVGAWERFTMR